MCADIDIMSKLALKSTNSVLEWSRKQGLMFS